MLTDNGPDVPEELCDLFFITKSKDTDVDLSVSRAIFREHDDELVLEYTDFGASFLLRLSLTEHRATSPSNRSANDRREIFHEGMVLTVLDSSARV